MGKEKLVSLWNKGKSFTKQESPAILAGFAIVGACMTAYCAWKAAPRYEQIMYEHEEAMKKVKKSDKKTAQTIQKETAQDLVLCMGPMIISLGATIGMIIGSHKVSARRIAALSAAYSFSSDMVKDLNQQMKKEFGPKKTDEVKKKVMEKRVRESNDGDIPTRTTEMAKNGLYWCRDYYTGQLFQTNSVQIDRAVNAISARARTEMYVTLKEFWQELEDAGAIGMRSLYRSPVGDEFGWNVDDLNNGELDISYTAVLDDDGAPILALEYNLINDFRNMYGK